MSPISEKVVFFIFIILFIFFGCSPKREGFDPESPQVTADKATVVSFAENVLPIFVRSCGICHQREEGHVRAVVNQVYYELKEDILNKVGTFIIPGKPEESGLLSVLNQSFPVGENQIVMPPPATGIPNWSEEELAIFSSWIKQGAKDN